MSGDIDLYGDWGAWEDREATREVDPMNAATLLFGNVPVPYTASWTSEESVFLARCPYADAIALCQPSSPGEGKPLFGKPHMCRQREVIALGLCDLCGKPLKNRSIAGEWRLAFRRAAGRAASSQGMCAALRPALSVAAPGSAQRHRGGAAGHVLGSSVRHL